MTSPEILSKEKKNKRLPSWLKISLPKGKAFSLTDANIHGKNLSTVCEQSLCPSRLECWSKKTATFLILGNKCSRNCGFCSISYGTKLPPPDFQEPEKIALSVKELGLKHVVITMVTRDDLNDGGAEHFVNVIRAVKQHTPSITIEILTSDFQGNFTSLKTLLKTNPEIFSHNLETVRKLTPFVRHKATYDLSLNILKESKKINPNILSKTGLMLGLGETEKEILTTLHELKDINVDIVTMGQYLQPSRIKLSVKQYIPPKKFAFYSQYGEKLGLFVFAGPFVRSSYNANEVFSLIKEKKNNGLL